MKWKETKALIKSDFARFENISYLKGIKYLLCNHSFKITFWFRLGSYLKMKDQFIYKILYFLVFIIHKHNQYLTGIQLPLGTPIGRSLTFPHFSCIVINGKASIGE